jgi:site-specific recombinase XerD
MSAHVVPSESGRVLGLLDTQVEFFFAHLRDAGYADRTLRKKRSVARSFSQWTRRKKVAVEDLDESHAAAFLRRYSRRQKAVTALRRGTLQQDIAPAR